jgi:hypothetical protein
MIMEWIQKVASLLIAKMKLIGPEVQEHKRD